MKTTLSILLLLFSFCVHGHPQDEDIILDIEDGQLRLVEGQMDDEMRAALERQRLRKLNAMSITDKVLMYVKSGIEHIVPKGLDHILFILGLYLSAVYISTLLWQVTAFTVAHTLTLGAAILGWVTIPASVIEPLIALSIVWVALENIVFDKPQRWRALVIFCFGLLHGLGFASVLTEYGLPKNDLITALISFNIGVEIGQLAILFVAALLTWRFRHHPTYKRWFVAPCSALIALIGLYWFIERVWF